MAYYERPEVKESIKKLVNVARVYTKTIKFNGDGPFLQWYTKILEKTKLKRLIQNSTLIKSVPGDFDKENVGYIAYLMDVKGKSFDEAYTSVVNEESVYYLTFVSHQEHEIENCEDCDGEGNMSCYDCEGTGDVSCHDCDGEGEVDCESCNGGERDCEECNEGKKDCESCDGRSEVECGNCEGYASVECDRCEGESFEKHVNTFDCDVFIIIDDRIDEIVEKLLSTEIGLKDLQNSLEKYEPPVPFSYLKNFGVDLYDDDVNSDWKTAVSEGGFSYENNYRKILIQHSHYYPDNTEVEEDISNKIP